jgi:hypothetical protein
MVFVDLSEYVSTMVIVSSLVLPGILTTEAYGVAPVK